MTLSHFAASKTLFGFWAFLMSDAVFFAALFATYAVLRNNTYGGPSAGELFSLPSALAQTLILLTSSFACGPAILFAYHKEKNKALAWLGLAFVLGAFFMAIEIRDFRHLVQQGHSWKSSAFLSAFFNLVGTHGMHILVGLLWMAVLAAQIICRGLTPVILKRLTCLRLFWHFLNIIWIFIFTFVYLLGASNA